ncbi:beta-ketoacyl-ACP synthase II [Schleiferiaceae bacterium]|jgi:3-oxoacyl-[acyl-carrier-protein] synthase II|nr:beta-ketoacyl-ACP synthase II [Bacteroidota bacterium]MCO4774584.1 beta-ketoacyl-ACP synthase II [Flavobacteriales bacterium]MDA8687083.1 beta-ketoacyl-ACP synthase II [Schleiferiaceae bacterium]MDA9147784.1 beta-ketoacyl-ACP synthase II [Schleiferiaceae bacterium]MDA9286192.1 beta-ketoacyl-ACP synthase II [Schleiferiaceae bacterium]
MSLKRVVVTGLGALTPVGNTAEETWTNLLAGKSGAGPITRFDASLFKTHFACEVKDFSPNDLLDRKEARRMDRFTQFGMVVADEAIADSGLDFEKENPDRIGVIWGSGIGGIDTFFEQVKGFIDNDLTPRFNPFLIPMMISDITPGRISMKHGLRGPNYTTVSACASSTNALIDAFNLIRLGKADVIVSGGSEAAINPVGMGGFNAMNALSTRNDDPMTASRPFDADRDGFVMGEGGAGIILEEYEHAKARGAKIYAEMVGGGLSADAHHLTAPHPEGLGARNVMANAIEDAGLKPEDIDYVNVHGTSTPLGDIAETKAIQKVFGEHAYNLNISSTKSMTGHLLGAAGAVEAMASIMAIYTGMVPPTINHFTDDENLDPKLNFTFHSAQEREVRAALSNTFGFGGHNASVLFKKAE